LGRTKALYGPRTQAYGETKILGYTKKREEEEKEGQKGFEFHKMGYPIKGSGHFIYGSNTVKG